MRLYYKRLGKEEKTGSGYIDGIPEGLWPAGHKLSPDDLKIASRILWEKGVPFIPSCDYYDSIYYEYYIES